MAALVVASCGGSNGDVDAVEAALDDAQSAVSSGDVEDACGHLAADARLQVRDAGHQRLPDCVTALRPILAALRREGTVSRQFGQPDVREVAVTTTAIATVEVDGRSIRVPMVKENGEWKLGSMYGLAPKRSVSVP